jgi:hypothetical protein
VTAPSSAFAGDRGAPWPANRIGSKGFNRLPQTRSEASQSTTSAWLDRSIDVQILRLRRKLAVDGTALPLIQTVRGVGYIFSHPVERIA